MTSLPREIPLPNPDAHSPAAFVFDTDQVWRGHTGFAFSELGEMVFLFSGDAQGTQRYYHGFDFGEAPNGVSFAACGQPGNDHYVLQAFNTLAQQRPPACRPGVIARLCITRPTCRRRGRRFERFIRLVTSRHQRSPVVLFTISRYARRTTNTCGCAMP
jgi:hypothetical protein